jgi:hypothetical protein
MGRQKIKAIDPNCTDRKRVELYEQGGAHNMKKGKKIVRDLPPGIEKLSYKERMIKNAISDGKLQRKALSEKANLMHNTPKHDQIGNSHSSIKNGEPGVKKNKNKFKSNGDVQMGEREQKLAHLAAEAIAIQKHRIVLENARQEAHEKEYQREEATRLGYIHGVGKKQKKRKTIANSLSEEAKENINRGPSKIPVYVNGFVHKMRKQEKESGSSQVHEQRQSNEKDKNDGNRETIPESLKPIAKLEDYKFKTELKPGESFKSYSKRIGLEKRQVLLGHAEQLKNISNKRKNHLNNRKAREKQKKIGKKLEMEEDSHFEAAFAPERIAFGDIADRPPIFTLTPKVKQSKKDDIKKLQELMNKSNAKIANDNNNHDNEDEIDANNIDEGNDNEEDDDGRRAQHQRKKQKKQNDSQPQQPHKRVAGEAHAEMVVALKKAQHEQQRFDMIAAYKEMKKKKGGNKPTLSNMAEQQDKLYKIAKATPRI